MALKDGYGVLIGTLSKYYRDDPDNFGKYYHGNIEVKTPTGILYCAIDVDSKNSATGVEWRVVELDKSDLKGIVKLREGWHFLDSNAVSGALDYIRSPELQLKDSNGNTWKQGTSIDALSDLEVLIESTPKKVYIFGEPTQKRQFFRTRYVGVHNIHQNQGDPIGSQWADENAIWQDGATLFQRQDDTIVAFLNKFKTQSNQTDDNGRPSS